MTLVLLPRGGRDYCGIGLLEPFWKVIEIIIDGRLEVYGWQLSKIICPNGIIRWVVFKLNPLLFICKTS